MWRQSYIKQFTSKHKAVNVSVPQRHYEVCRNNGKCWVNIKLHLHFQFQFQSDLCKIPQDGISFLSHYKWARARAHTHTHTYVRTYIHTQIIISYRTPYSPWTVKLSVRCLTNWSSFSHRSFVISQNICDQLKILSLNGPHNSNTMYQ